MGLRAKLFAAFALTVLVSTFLALVLSLRFVAATFLEHLGMAGLQLGAYPFHISQALNELSTADRLFLQSLGQGLLLAGGLGLLFGLGVSIFVSGRLIVPIVQLRDAVRALAKGLLETRVIADNSDELGELGREINRLAEELERAENLRRNLVADVAHELRTPLSGIQAYLEALQDGVIEADTKNIGKISGELGRLTRLVADLEQLSRIDAGQVHLKLTEVDIAELVDTVLSVRQPDLEDHRVETLRNYAGHLRIIADPDRVLQIVHNLVANALNHVKPGGQLLIEAEANPPYLRVTVANEGPELDPADLPHLFERFFRSDRSRSRQTGGAGLGLTISKKLAQLHSGDLVARNIPGWGVAFDLHLPLAGPAGKK